MTIPNMITPLFLICSYYSEEHIKLEEQRKTQKTWEYLSHDVDVRWAKNGEWAVFDKYMCNKPECEFAYMIKRNIVNI